ncbi:unnamed protein product [Choristocarpus tenellus]
MWMVMSVMATITRDPCSQSNPSEVAVTHASLDLEVDFATKTIKGSVEYDVEIQEDGAERFVMDTSKLTVAYIKVGAKPARFLQHPPHNVFGNALEVFLPKEESNSAYAKGDKLKVKVGFSTSPQSTAVQWLPPEQTHGGMRPYLFTQCQAIHARSLLPCQDSPAVKITYDAKVTVPSWATCLMSALAVEATSGPGEGKGEDGTRTFCWTQPMPIPSYLIAIAVGALESRDISHRCRIWAEDGVVDKAAYDFSQTEEFLATAETLVGPYEWGRYDVLCLPPSFPYGGMENPCLTFVTPTLLAGDKSLAFVIAHEISHSWTGNLVTNSTWEHFWLNEGWTVWLERNIMSEVTGNPFYYSFSAKLKWAHLQDDVARYELNREGALTVLLPNLEGIDPDDAFSSVPYEKGFALLNQLQSRVGVEDFKAFALHYISTFRKGIIDSHTFRDFFLKYFAHKEKEIEDFDWRAWLEDPGMPPETPTFDETMLVTSRQLADAWLGVDGPPNDTEEEIFKSWPSLQKVAFLQRILDSTEESGKKMSLASLKVTAMDKAYGLTSTGNSEQRFLWHTICLRAEAWFIVPHVLDFITSMGRMKFTRPLYRELNKHEKTAGVACETFRKRALFYHPICRRLVAQDIGVELGEERSNELLGGD